MSDPERTSEDQEILEHRAQQAEEQIRRMEWDLQNVRHYQKELQSLHAENAILKSRIETLTQEGLHKTEQLNELYQKWEGSTQQSHLIAKENNALLARLEAAHQHAEKLDQEILAKSGAILELQLEMQARTHSIPALRQENERLRAEIADLKAQIQKMLSDDFVGNMNRIREQESAFFRDRIQTLTESFQKEQAVLQAEIRQLEDLNRKKEYEIHKMQHQLGSGSGSVELELRRLREEVHNLEVSAKIKDSLLQDLNRKLQASRQEMEKSKKEWNDQRRPMEDEVRDKEVRILELEHSLEILKAAHERIKQEYASSSKEGAPQKPQAAPVRPPAPRDWVEAVPVPPAPAADSPAVPIAEPSLPLPDDMEQVIFGVSQKYAEPSPAEPAAPEKPALGPGGLKSRKKILIAENNSETIQIMTQVLTNEGYQVFSVQEGEAIFGLIQSESPDLVVTNIAVGQQDAFNLGREISKNPSLPEIPMIVIASSPAFTEVFRQSPPVGIPVSFLYKPFSLRELLQAVQSIFSAKAS